MPLPSPPGVPTRPPMLAAPGAARHAPHEGGQRPLASACDGRPPSDTPDSHHTSHPKGDVPRCATIRPCCC